MGIFHPQKSIRTEIEKSSTYNCLFHNFKRWGSGQFQESGFNRREYSRESGFERIGADQANLVLPNKVQEFDRISQISKSLALFELEKFFDKKKKLNFRTYFIFAKADARDINNDQQLCSSRK